MCAISSLKSSRSLSHLLMSSCCFSYSLFLVSVPCARPKAVLFVRFWAHVNISYRIVFNDSPEVRGMLRFGLIIIDTMATCTEYCMWYFRFRVGLGRPSERVYCIHAHQVARLSSEDDVFKLAAYTTVLFVIWKIWNICAEKALLIVPLLKLFHPRCKGCNFGTQY